MIAVIILGLLASAAALSFTQPLRAARNQDACEMLRSFDDTARQVARRLGQPVTLRFDLAEGVIERREADRVTYRGTLPHGCRIRELRTSARRAGGGIIEIPCSFQGATRTYAVRLQAGDFDRWLLISGLAGEMTLIHDEAQLDAIFSATTARAEAREAASHDAD